MQNPGKPPLKTEDGSDSDSSNGSLEAIDQVDEDLNRNEGTRAAGFFWKEFRGPMDATVGEWGEYDKPLSIR